MSNSKNPSSPKPPPKSKVVTKGRKSGIPATSKPDLTCIEGIEAGLTIIAMSAQNLAIHVKNIFEKAVLKQKTISHVGMPVVEEMLSLHTGSARQMAQERAFIILNEQEGGNVKHEYEELPSRGNFDYLTDAGQLVLISKIDELGAGVLTLTYVISGSFTPLVLSALMNIGNAAKQAGTFVLMFVVCDPTFNKLSLQPLCDELIVVDVCEPDVDYDLAFSIEFVGLKEMGIVGVGKSMCQIKSSKGKLIHWSRTFIASDLETRAMWVMRQQEMTLDAIGKHFGGLHKSNVSKRLKGLPNPPSYKVNEDWVKQYLVATSNGDMNEMSPPKPMVQPEVVAKRKHN